jgi:hypothetical protein
MPANWPVQALYGLGLCVVLIGPLILAAWWAERRPWRNPKDPVRYCQHFEKARREVAERYAREHGNAAS